MSLNINGCNLHLVVISTLHIHMCLCVLFQTWCALCHFFFVLYSMYHTWYLGASELHNSCFIGCGPLKHIVAVLCDLLSVLQAFPLSSLRQHHSEGGCETLTLDRWMYRNGEVEVRDECKRLKRSEETKHNQKSCALVLLNGGRFECFCVMRFEWMNRL